MSKAPGYVKATLAVALVGVGTVGYTAYLVNQKAHDACEFVVDARDDNRAVWLFLLHRASTDQAAPETIEFKDYLDHRLPPLECVGNTPTPITQEDNP
jgi:hypothetical protein